MTPFVQLTVAASIIAAILAAPLILTLGLFGVAVGAMFLPALLG